MTLAEPCPDESTLFSLVDEPDDTNPAAKHVTTCQACAARVEALRDLFTDMQQPVRAHAADGFVQRLTNAIADGERPREEVRPVRRRTTVLLLGGALALAAAVAIVPRLAGIGDSDGFAARGIRGEAGAARDVALELDLLSRTGANVTVSAVTPATHAPPSAHLLVSFATRTAETPFHLLCFAVDKTGDVHWLYPAFDDATSDPASVVLPAGKATTPMPTEALLDGIPPGRLRIFALVSSRPMHVSDIEQLPPVDLGAVRLSTRFPGVDVRSWELSLDAGREGGAR